MLTSPPYLLNCAHTRNLQNPRDSSILAHTCSANVSPGTRTPLPEPPIPTDHCPRRSRRAEPAAFASARTRQLYTGRIARNPPVPRNAPVAPNLEKKSQIWKALSTNEPLRPPVLPVRLPTIPGVELVREGSFTTPAVKIQIPNPKFKFAWHYDAVALRGSAIAKDPASIDMALSECRGDRSWNRRIAGRLRWLSMCLRS